MTTDALREIRAYAEHILSAIGLIAFIATVIFTAGLAQSIYESDQAQQESVTRVCGFNHGDCR
jgi:hypothetical protein